VARPAGRGEHGGPCRGDLLVRAAVAADVLAHPGDVEEWVRLLDEPGGGVRADGGAVRADGMGRTEAWVEDVGAGGNLAKLHVSEMHFVRPNADGNDEPYKVFVRRNALFKKLIAFH
jgi:hypothetical protein